MTQLLEAESQVPADIAPVVGRIWTRAMVHRPAWIALAIFVIASLLWSFGWNPIFDHQTGWLQSGDLWGYFRASQTISWGWFGGAYQASTGVVTLPGLLLLLVPVAWGADALHLSTSFPYALPHPSAWLLLFPATLLLAAAPLVAADSLALHHGLSQKGRLWLAMGQAAVWWVTITQWGHPEDAIATALVLWAILAVQRARWGSAAWLLALGVGFQPIAALAVPVIWSQFPRGQRIAGLIRIGLLPAMLVGAVWWSNPAGASRAFLKQLNYPSIDHATPWVTLAPRVGRGHWTTQASLALQHHRLALVHSRAFTGVAVSAGPMRMVLVLVLVILGLSFLWRNHHLDTASLLWWSSAAFAWRCLLEPVMNPFYLVPYLALALLVPMVRRRHRAAMVIFVIAGLQLGLSYAHWNPWPWYIPQVACTFAILWLSRPGASPAAVMGGVDDGC